MAEKERLDVVLVNKNLVSSRERAKALIMAGKVFVDNEKEDKSGKLINVNANIEVKENKMKYVSRGGYKLEKSIEAFDINLQDKICMDVGASTGGFTDCMLQNGAKKVFSIDVGYGQFDWKLRQDERVVCMEKTNIRYVTIENTKEYADFASIDVSFISLTKVLEPVKNLLNENGEIVCLIKPQFEAGREKVGKKGVVKDKNVHKEVIVKVLQFATSQNLFVKGLTFSPIKGPEGNIEYLAYLTKVNNVDIVNDYEALIENIVSKSHENLD